MATGVETIPRMRSQSARYNASEENGFAAKQHGQRCRVASTRRVRAASDREVKVKAYFLGNTSRLETIAWSIPIEVTF